MFGSHDAIFWGEAIVKQARKWDWYTLFSESIVNAFIRMGIGRPKVLFSDLLNSMAPCAKYISIDNAFDLNGNEVIDIHVTLSV